MSTRRPLGDDIVTDFVDEDGNPVKEPETTVWQNKEGTEPTNENDVRLMGGVTTWYQANDGTWYAAYKLPNSNSFALFEASQDQMDQLFGENIRPVSQRIRAGEDLINKGNFYFSGNVAEVTGDGNFQAEVNRIIAQGLEDGMLPDWASASGKIMDLIYIAQSENKSPDWLIEQISKTTEFKQRFKGIDHIYNAGLGVADAVKAYREYETGLDTYRKRYGLKMEITPDTVAGLLKRGHSLDDVGFVFQAFDRMRQHAPALQAFNDILARRGLPPMTADDQFKFMSGRAPQHLYDIWEEVSVLESARGAGLGNYVNVNDAIKLARRTVGHMSSADIDQSMQEAAMLALRFRGDIDARRYGIDPDDLIDVSLGIAPRSGNSIAEVRDNLTRVAKAAEGLLRQQSGPYVGYSQTGTPQAASLSNLRRQGA